MHFWDPTCPGLVCYHRHRGLIRRWFSFWWRNGSCGRWGIDFRGWGWVDFYDSCLRKSTLLFKLRIEAALFLNNSANYIVFLIEIKDFWGSLTNFDCFQSLFPREEYYHYKRVLKIEIKRILSDYKPFMTILILVYKWNLIAFIVSRW